MKSFLLSQIGNADQIPLNFDMPSSTTAEQKDVQSVYTEGLQVPKTNVLCHACCDRGRAEARLAHDSVPSQDRHDFAHDSGDADNVEAEMRSLSATSASTQTLSRSAKRHFICLIKDPMFSDCK